MKIFIDPGHGGSDNGATGNGLLEKNLNLAVSLKLKPLLIEKGFNVLCSRESDVTVTLEKRSAQAIQWGADALLSIHHNAFNGNARGIETFHSAYSTKSKKLGECVHQELLATFALPNRGLKTRTFVSSPQDYYHMIRVPLQGGVPGIITETGFIDNAQDAAVMKQPDFAQKQAHALLKGICSYFGITDKLGNVAIAHSEADFHSADRLIRYVGGGKILVKSRIDYKKELAELERCGTDVLYIVGGTETFGHIKAAEKINLSGQTYFHTVQNVGKYLRIL